MKIAISTSSFGSIDTTPLDKMRSKGLQVIQNPYERKLTEKEIINHLEGVDGLLAGLEPLNKNVFDSCPQLKAIARVGIGMDNVDIVEANKAKIKISNTPDAPTNAVAEMTLSAALCLSRDILSANAAMHKKLWVKSVGNSLKKSNILIIGYGRIGRCVAKVFHKFDSNIFIYDPLIKPTYKEKDVTFVELNEGLEVADIITIHAGGKNTILTSTEFTRMKNGVILLNSARGSLISEIALADALDTGRVKSAWLDVFPEEPYKGILTEYNQVLLTPHMSTYSAQCRKDMESAAVHNLLSDLGVEL